ncbi:MAG: hypothetical protein HDS24_04195 [Bacteroides sp.]|nr:hypothetical protein [Bacteroidales bacterium]MBD5291259.1 hypothetical protein [Bacteroides sp.]
MILAQGLNTLLGASLHSPKVLTRAMTQPLYLKLLLASCRHYAIDAGKIDVI